MNEYEKIVRKQRIEKAKLTTDSLKKIHRIYENSVNEMADRISKMGYTGIDDEWLTANYSALMEHEEKLRRQLESVIKDGVSKAADIGIEGIKQINSDMLKSTGINIGGTYESMFAKIHQNVVDDIVTGNLYKDNKTLSDRIWNYTNQNGKDIQDVIAQGLAQKKDPRMIAAELRQFVKPPQLRDPDFAKKFSEKAAKLMDYYAMRLARTAFNHSYQTATIQASESNPFIEGIMWQSTLDHRACELCRERHGTIYKKDEVPLDHPNGVCTMVPHITKSPTEIADEIADWINGDDNPGIDNWVSRFKFR